MTQEWSQQIVDRVGREVRRIRGAARPALSAQALSDRTAELGHPISRAVISDLETGRRRGLDVADLMVLAAALRVAPVQLLFPDLPRGTVSVLPDLDQESHDAVRWFGGEAGLLTPSESWTDGRGEPTRVWTRTQLDSHVDRVTLTRAWLKAIASMRSARTQIRSGVLANETPEQLEALEILYDSARERVAALAEVLTADGLIVGEDHPRA